MGSFGSALVERTWISNMKTSLCELDMSTPIDGTALKNAVVLIIRHAEKPDKGPGLSTAGEARAQAYVRYFQNFKVSARRLVPDYLFAAADSSESQRPRLTLEPLSRALSLVLHTAYKDKQYNELAVDLTLEQTGRAILICWHHGEIPSLVQALGADPDMLLPKGKWPDAEFGWVLQLSYDAEGRFLPEGTRRIDERPQNPRLLNVPEGRTPAR
jgi:hypothetical protein